MARSEIRNGRSGAATTNRSAARGSLIGARGRGIHNGELGKTKSSEGRKRASEGGGAGENHLGWWCELPTADERNRRETRHETTWPREISPLPLDHRPPVLIREDGAYKLGGPTNKRGKRFGPLDSPRGVLCRFAVVLGPLLELGAVVLPSSFGWARFLKKSIFFTTE